MYGRYTNSELLAYLTLLDAHVVILDIPNHPDCAIFGIFDGHGGSEVARYLADKLGQCICKLPDMFDEKGRKLPVL